MAIAALLGFLGAHRVRHEGGESLAGEAGRGNRLLRVVKPIAIGVLRADEHGARGPRWGDAVAGDRAVDAEHVNVIAENLEIVAGGIFIGQSFVLPHGLPGTGLSPHSTPAQKFAPSTVS